MRTFYPEYPFQVVNLVCPIVSFVHTIFLYISDKLTVINSLSRFIIKNQKERVLFIRVNLKRDQTGWRETMKRVVN